MKKLEIEISGTEEIRHLRTLCAEVPDDATDEEIKGIKSFVFDDIPEPPAWEYEESFGTFGTDIAVDVVGVAGQNRSSDCRLVRDEFGDLILQDD